MERAPDPRRRDLRLGRRVHIHPQALVLRRSRPHAQTKIDIAPDTILVDSEVVAIIEEQQRWVRDRFPGIQPKHLFLQLTGNRAGSKPYPSGTYTFRLREFSKIVQVADSKGRSVRLSHTHRFRHTKFTRLAER